MVKEGTAIIGNIQQVHSENVRVVYKGTWLKIVDIGSVGGSYRQSSTTGDTAAFKYTGANAWIYFHRTTSSGILGITLDSNPEILWDLYPPSGAGDYKVGSLIVPYGAHTIALRITGSKNAASSGYDLNLVSFAYELLAGSQQAFSFQEETLNVVSLGGGGGTPTTSKYVIYGGLDVALPNAQSIDNLGSDVGPSADASYKLGPTSGKGFTWLYLSRAVADPGGIFEGVMWYRSDLTKIRFRDSAIVRSLVDEALAQTLTNKTLGTGTVYGDNPNFAEYQAVAFRTENLAALPGAGNKGRLVFRTSDNTLWYDNGAAFVQAG